MDILRQILLVIHLVGFAALLGGLLIQSRAAEKAVDLVTVWGARIAFLAGLLLVGVLEAGDADVNNAKVGVKLLVGLVVVGLLEANRRKPRIPDGLYWGLVGLTVLNVCVAVLWSSAHA